MAGWPVASIPDKVALCVANLMETHLRQNLASNTDNLEWSLSYWVEQALVEILRISRDRDRRFTASVTD